MVQHYIPVFLSIVFKALPREVDGSCQWVTSIAMPMDVVNEVCIETGVPRGDVICYAHECCQSSVH